jgi:type I restriction enzyme S subunit
MEVREIAFSDLLTEVVDNRGKTCPTASTGIPLIATNCVRNDVLYPTYANVRYVSHETYSSWFRGHPKPGDILFVNKATPGRVCLVPDPVDFCVAQDMVAIRANPKIVYPKFLFAVLRSPLVQERIGTMHVGTLIPHFKKGDFGKLLIPVPDERTQRFVGDTYFDLSAKIDMNRRMNETLEAMARALFQSWFVDFDPVHRNIKRAQGHTPPNHHHAEFDALFPDAFEDSELGMIPKGWRVTSLDAIASFLNGLALQKYPARSGDFLPVIKIAQLRTGNTIGADRASREVPRPYHVQDGDVLFSWSGSLACVLWSGGPGALNQHLFKVTSDEFPKWFYYGWVHHHLADFQYIAAGKATTMGHIQRHHLTDAKVVVPPKEVVKALGIILSPLVESQWQRNVESRTLAALRDALLPKLISGEVWVKDAERFVEGAV